MRIKTESLLGFSNEANMKNDVMVGSKGGTRPRRKKKKKKKGGWGGWL